MKEQGIGNREQGIAGKGFRTGLVFVGLSLVAMVASAQIQLGSLGQAAEAKRPEVLLLTDSVQVKAGKRQMVELRFRVEPGFHINSHTPLDPLLIPTVLKIGSNSVHAGKAVYPKGSSFRLAIGAGETLDVYQNEFGIGVPVVVPQGASEIAGTLRYQACDNRSCFPPKSLPVRIRVTGR